MALVATGCHFGGAAPLHAESPPGSWYVIAPGENLEVIARRADVPMDDLVEINGLADPSDARPGRLIFVLASRGQPSTDLRDIGDVRAGRDVRDGRASGEDQGLPPLAAARAPLRWPLATGRIFVGSPFGTREGRPHEGIDLPAPVGTPVFAAGDGRVVYAGNGIRGYGNLVVVRHSGDLLTVYAHNSVLLVAQGQPVRAGDRIALVGQSGHATGPHLHFEVRAGQIPRNPMRFLPELAKGSS